MRNADSVQGQPVIIEHGRREYLQNRCQFGSRSWGGEVAGATMLCAGEGWIVWYGTAKDVVNAQYDATSSPVAAQD